MFVYSMSLKGHLFSFKELDLDVSKKIGNTFARPDLLFFHFQFDSTYFTLVQLVRKYPSPTVFFVEERLFVDAGES